MPYLPAGVHVAVVDPGVGTARRGVIVVAGASVLVGPDNGLLLPAAAALGGVTGCFELSEPRFRLPAVSATFHGRDIFAPAAAHLANGEQPAAFGAEVDPGELVRLPEPALRVDHFGNVQLAGGADALAAVGASGDRVIVEFGRSEHAAVVGRTFGDVPLGGLLVHVDSAGAVAIAVNGGSAAAVLGGEGRLGGEGARTGGLGGAGAGVAGVGVGGSGGAGAVLVVRRG
jgi:S-adenosylmethionine hydrolase